MRSAEAVSGDHEAAPGVRFSILTAVFGPPADAFEDTVASVRGQRYVDWEWILVDDRSPDPATRQRLERLAVEEPRVRIHLRDENGGIGAASQDALARAGGEFVVLLDHDDVLAPDALSRAADLIAGSPDVDYLYSDLDRMRAAGDLHGRIRKPEWSPERLRHHNYLSHLSVLRRALVQEVGGFRAGFDGSQDHDLILRVTERARSVVHVPEVLYHWREVPGSAAGDADAKPWAWEAGVRAVQDHLDRVAIPGVVRKGRAVGTYDIEREPDLTTPTSIIIAAPSRAGAATVSRTARDALQTSGHRDLELVVVHEPSMESLLVEQLHELDAGRTTVRLVESPRDWSPSRRSNLGALEASGENLVFLEAGLRTVSSGVVERLVAPLTETGVGATGAKLLLDDGRVSDAGLVYGSGAIARTYYQMRPDGLGAYGDLWSNREVSALSGSCLALRREVFDEVGGFCESLDALRDVDLGHKIRRTGRRLVWLHSVVLRRVEAPARTGAVPERERELICRRWGDYEEIPERYAIDVDRVVRAHRRQVRVEQERADGDGSSGG